MNQAPSYILWLPSWYPNKLAPYDGDFIQRHAKAVSAYIPLHVLHIIRDEKGTITKSLKIEENKSGNLAEVIIYYYSRKRNLKILDRFLSMNKFGKIYRDYISLFFKANDLPELVHVHISFKSGLIAGWIEKRWGIPYVLTEHWTVYLDEAKPALNDLSFVHQYMISKIMTNALLVLPVSDYLGKALKKKWPSIEFETIPNVVDTDIFYSAEQTPNNKLHLIHISTFTYQKDPENLFKALGLLKKEDINFSLDLFGPVTESILNLVKVENIEKEIIIHGEVPQLILSEYLKKADALILYSRYESFGCVIIEANACGVPVIVTDTQLMHELVEENINGILVQPGSAIELAKALMNYSVIKNSFNRNKIAARTIEKYSFNKVGKMIAGIYDRYRKS